jgi:hypothetical protein
MSRVLARGLLTVGVLLALVPAQPGGASDRLSLRVLGTRPQLLSAGDALVEVVGARARARVFVDGLDVTRSFARRGDGPLAGRLVGRVVGLTAGRHVLRASADGQVASVEVTNHARGGPVFSGPQVQPWICTTEANGLGPALDRQCNGRTTVTYEYQPHGSPVLLPYDTAAPPPPATVAMTTTDQGRTVPYVVRVERGTLNRAVYAIATLALPGQPLEPWRTQPGWNHKLLFTFGGGCAPGHSQMSPPDVTLRTAFVSQLVMPNPILDVALGRGFAVGSSSLDAMGNACNLNVSAETLLMVKERITEQYGEIRYTIGDGCSGGAEAQNSIAENYPGLLDGLRPTCSFPDAWTPAVFYKSDCALLEHYFTEVSPGLWGVAAQREAVLGMPEAGCLATWQGRSAEEDWDPHTGCKDGGAMWVYDPATNPGGTRCTLQDYNAAALGRRRDGFGNGVLDDTGVLWGLGALRSGLVTADQFVDLNAKVGGWTIDYSHQAARTRADDEGLRRAYATGQVSWGSGLASTPSIDARTDWNVDLHGNVMREAVRARVLRAAGSTGALVLWDEVGAFGNGSPSPLLAEQSLLVMDRWLASVEADRRPGTRADKVRRNRPGEARDGCFTGGRRVADGACPRTTAGLPRVVAGMPRTLDVLACRLVPMTSRAGGLAGLALTTSQWQALRSTFPTGVCDYTRPGRHQGPPLGTWLDLSDPVGPRELHQR